LHLSLFFVWVLLGCGASDNNENEPETTYASDPGQPGNELEGNQDEVFAFQGFVVNAFSVTVDGQEYPDMETFYTEELGRLPEKVTAAGYDGGYDVDFRAQIGFRDLWQGMTVYIAADQSAGYQGEAQVAHGGEFSIDLPKDAQGATYRVRANKRIQLVLTKTNDIVTLCYNFSALERSVSFSNQSQPIILDTFETRLTRYECESENDSQGVSIPGNEQESTTKLSYGMSKAQVLQILGADGLVIDTDNRWCWHPSGFEAHTNCAVNVAASCQCYIDFADDDTAIAQYNINSDMLDILSW
jgi:hypothetical protein